MATFTDEDLLQLDEKFAKEGVAFHARPLRAAVEILKGEFAIGGAPFHNPQVDEICQAYRRLISECDTTWPGAGNGLIGSLDRIRKVTVPVVMGSEMINIGKGLEFASDKEWYEWCRRNPRIIARSAFAFADIYDLAYGIEEHKGGHPVAMERWVRATENLADLSSRLADSGNLGEAILQPIGLTAELSLKGTLIHLGMSPEDLTKKTYGHGYQALAEKLVQLCPHRDDPEVLRVIASLPQLVASRYDVTGLTRLQIIELALGVQFVAASAVRRISSYDLAKDMEATAPRPAFFT